MSQRRARLLSVALVALGLSLALACSEEEPDPPRPDAAPEDATAGADGATDAAAKEPPPLTADELVNACARTSACKITAYPEVASCVDAYFKLHRSQGLDKRIYDDLYRCVNAAAGIIEVLDCRALDKFCYQPEKGGPICRGNRRDSCTGFKASCLKNVAVTCAGGRQHWLDCSALAPVTSLCKSGACIKAKQQCAKAMNTCSGDKLKACLDGGHREIDCKALGLGPCKAATYGANCTDPNEKNKP